MARIRHSDRILYVVSWDESGIIKIGFADHLSRRLRAFRAARLVLALTFPTSLAGYEFEIAAHRVAWTVWPKAFGSRTEALPYIIGTGGFRECYRATPAEALDLIASQCGVTISHHNATTHCDASRDRHTATSRSYGRTDGLTETGGFRDGKNFRYVTRGRASRIFGFAGLGNLVGLATAAVAVSLAACSSTAAQQTYPPAASTVAAQPGAPSSTPRPAGTGSSFDLKDESGDTYRVTLIKVIDPAQDTDQFPATPDQGTRFVAAVFSIKALTGSPQNEDANNDAELLGTNDQGYDTTVENNIVGYTNFDNGMIQIAQGQTEVGAVTFQVPDGVKIADVQWVASSGFGQFVQWNVEAS